MNDKSCVVCLVIVSTAAAYAPAASSSPSRGPVRPAITAPDKFGTSIIREISVDKHWNEHRAYLQRIIDTVHAQSERNLGKGTDNPSRGKVTVTFILNSKGEVVKIVKVDSASTGEPSRACVGAITARSPYGPWTDKMIAVFGTEQKMAFTFYFQ